MQAPAQLKPALWGAVGGAIALAIVGFTWGGWMTGGKSARWIDEDMADTFTRKAEQFIEAHQQEPFFLFFATHDVHVPRVPHPRFQGSSSVGTRGDAFIVAPPLTSTDEELGELLARLRATLSSLRPLFPGASGRADAAPADLRDDRHVQPAVRLVGGDGLGHRAVEGGGFLG